MYFFFPILKENSDYTFDSKSILFKSSNSPSLRLPIRSKGAMPVNLCLFDFSSSKNTQENKQINGLEQKNVFFFSSFDSRRFNPAFCLQNI